jgi:uncharacterized protein
MTEQEILELREQIKLYLHHAHRALEAARLTLDHDFYDAAINRAYYAIFYAATALLLTRNITRAKHSGVVSAFREQFVKTGLIETEYSDLYGTVMESRINSDYEVTLMADSATAEKALDAAERFLQRAGSYLREQEWVT